VKHLAGVEQLQVWFQPAALALQRTEQEHAAGMVEKQVVFGVANVLGDVAHQRGVGDGDVGDGLGQLHNHDLVSLSDRVPSLLVRGPSDRCHSRRPSHKKRHMV